MKKLKSQSGVSLSVALLFFVVCAALASMILAAAYAASGRVTNKMTLNQDQYAANSAASLISKELQNDVIVIQETADVKQNEDGMYTVQTQADGSDINTSYYEVNYDAAASDEVPTTLEGFDISKTRNVTDASNQSLLVKEYAGMYSAYLSSSDYSDATKKIYQAKFANASLASLTSRKSSFEITVGSDSKLQCHADMTLASDLSLDIVVTSNSSSIHVYCAPQVTTTYTYMVKDEGDVNGLRIVTKTTVISFGKAKVTRS
ncbi:MAG: hypothetical protein SOI44_02170 [Lactimicrobium sp.]|uniref:hypothetical protein n=2 Tax=Lactimicrobium sp. TaxID=2563780 RepID=UPI002F356804